jgi:hypothetical protein
MYFGGYYIVAQEVTSNYVLSYILCVDKGYIFSIVKFYLTSSVLLASPRFHVLVHSFKCYVDHSHTVYSTGNVDVRN